MKIMIWVVCILLGYGQQVWAQKDANVLKELSVVVATDGHFPPFNYFKEGKLSGFEVDLAELLFSKMGLKVEWKVASFDTLLIGLSQGKYDVVIASHGVTEARSKVVDFSEPHYCTGVVLVSRPGGPRSLQDLVGKRAAVQLGTIFAPTLNSVEGIKEVKTFKQDADCLQALVFNRVDAWATDKFVADAAIKAQKKQSLQRGEPLLNEKVAIAVKKGNTSLLKRINSGLKKMFDDGSYLMLSKKYFQEDISCLKVAQETK